MRSPTVEAGLSSDAFVEANRTFVIFLGWLTVQLSAWFTEMDIKEDIKRDITGKNNEELMRHSKAANLIIDLIERSLENE